MFLHLQALHLSDKFLKIHEHFNFPSLRNEISRFLAKFEVVDVKSFTKEKWKQFVNRSILQLNRDQSIEEMKSMKKLDYIELSLEDFKLKDYFSELNLDLSRIKFRSRSLTMTSCATHYPSDDKFIKSMFEYKNSCGNIDGLTHWKYRNCFSHLIPQNLEDDRQLCQFYKNIIQPRTESP